MGVLLRLDSRLPASGETPRPAAGRRAVAFHFDLGCPFSYLAAERVERVLGEVMWVPVSPARPDPQQGTARWRSAAERRARELRLALSWPERLPVCTREAHRLAIFARELGAGSRFALAAARLAFCGGFDLGERSVLLEAAAAAGISALDARSAALDEGRDAQLRTTAARLQAAAIDRLPAILIDGRWFVGEAMLEHAAGAGMLSRARAR